VRDCALYTNRIHEQLAIVVKRRQEQVLD